MHFLNLQKKKIEPNVTNDEISNVFLSKEGDETATVGIDILSKPEIIMLNGKKVTWEILFKKLFTG